MKTLLLGLVSLVLAAAAQAAPIHYYGEITGTGQYAGVVNSSNAWGNPPFGMNQNQQDINLWGFEATAGQSLSVAMNTLDNFTGGFSLYFGEITNMNLLFGMFNNSGDTGNAQYLAGTTTFGADSSLSDILLESTGFYTLAVGGKSFGFGNHYAYTLDVVKSSVPEASSLLLMGTGLLGIFALRRRRTDKTLTA